MPLPAVDAEITRLAEAAKLPIADVARGRQLLVGACASCHEPVHPLDCPLAQWVEVMPRMLRKSELPASAGACVLAYVTVVRRAAGAP